MTVEVQPLQVLSNIVRSIVLFLLLFAIVYAVAFAAVLLFQTWRFPDHYFAEQSQRAYETVVYFKIHIAVGCVLWAAFAMSLNQLLVGAGSGCRMVAPGALPRVEKILENLCLRAGISCPKLALIEAEEMNAFASGLYRDEHMVAVSTGLIKNLSDEEIEAVIAHELTHIENKDVFLMTVATTVAGGLALVAELILFGISKLFVFLFAAFEGEEGFLSGVATMILGIVLVIFAAVVSWLASLALSRSREFLADAGAAKMTGNPKALISALNKIVDDCDIGASSGVMQMCIETPQSILQFLSTHPPTDKRISALKALIPHYQTGRSQVDQFVKRSSAGGMRVRASFGRRNV